jgi:hypothetical protein
MKSLRRQSGLSLIGVAILAFLIIFFGLLIVILSGTYSNHFTIDKMIQTSLEGQTASRFSSDDFVSRLSKNLEVNQIRMDMKKDLTINKRKTPYTIVLDYEKRVHLFSNVDVVMTFHEEYEL